MSNAHDAPPWSKQHPYPARLLHQRMLTATTAVKQVMHLEVDLGDSGLSYSPGDTLAFRIDNDPALVDEVLQLCELSGDVPTAKLLRTQYELTQVHPGFFKHFAAACTDPALHALMADTTRLRSYLEHRQIVDVLRDFPCRLSGEQLVSCLRQLQDRQYSIASSQLKSPHSAALTVGLLQFQQNDHERLGAGSGFLGRRISSETALPVYVVSNPNFRLPENPATPIIMIGPGTGIAPFRGFLQEREATGAGGNNWLIVGNRRQSEDFLYRDELQQWQQNGLLTRLDIAFSRDGAEKYYVQHLLLQHAAKVYAWLQVGAHLYVCGDAKHMAEDVQRTLLLLIEQQGGLDAAKARQYLVTMRQQKRYQRDVY